MKTLGIIGGLGPESTIDYYQRIIAMYRERTADGSYPQFIINSVNLRKGLDFMDANDLDGMADYLLEAIGKLARAGAEFGLISANTPHIVFDEIAPKSPIPLISIVEATCAAAKAHKLKRLALFGTRYTMQAPFYQKVFSREGIGVLVPEPATDRRQRVEPRLQQRAMGVLGAMRDGELGQQRSVSFARCRHRSPNAASFAAIYPADCQSAHCRAAGPGR